MRFEERIALVTGASSGIGRAAAVLLAERGARVVLVGRDVARGEEVAHEITARGGAALFLQGDVSRSDHVERTVERAVREYGRLDIALNNAGIEGAIAPTTDLTEAQFDEIIGTNLKGVWLGLKFQIPRMLAHSPPGGAIVNTSSVNGLGGVAHASAYAASKAGVLALTKSAALEYASVGVRVNALVAGPFRTAMQRRVFTVLSGGDEQAMESAERQLTSMVPMGRSGTAEEAAEAALWLLSDAASFVTGHSLIIDGGMTAWAR